LTKLVEMLPKRLLMEMGAGSFVIEPNGKLITGDMLNKGLHGEVVWKVPSLLSAVRRQWPKKSNQSAEDWKEFIQGMIDVGDPTLYSTLYKVGAVRGGMSKWGMGNQWFEFEKPSEAAKKTMISVLPKQPYSKIDVSIPSKNKWFNDMMMEEFIEKFL